MTKKLHTCQPPSGFKFMHRPLKAYEVYEPADYPFRKEYVFGVFAGRTAGQARAQVAQEREIDNPWAFLRSRRCTDKARETEVIEEYEDRGKYWKNTRKCARFQAEVEAFNAAHPVGTAVQVKDCCEASQWPDGLTKTRTPAWVAGNFCPLVSVDGQAGGMYLRFIFPVTS